MPMNEDEYDDERFEDEDEAQSLPQGYGREGISRDEVEPQKQSFSHECSWKAICIDEVELGEQLGGGSVGLVHRGMYRGERVALKTLVS